MLRLVLTAEDGGTAWRHYLAPDEARTGWECVGPAGLARRLGRLYGLRPDAAPHAERVADYAARLALIDDGDRSFSRSRAKDPWGVAAFLLALRDRLRAAGWDGGLLPEGSGRLTDLASAERVSTRGQKPIPPALADVFAGLLLEVEQTGRVPEPLEVLVVAPQPAFDVVVQRTLDALTSKGASIVFANTQTPSATEATDLGRLQRMLVTPTSGASCTPLTNDGSVLCLEADTALEAAELLAAYLRSRPLAQATLVGGRDLRALAVAMARPAGNWRT